MITAAMVAAAAIAIYLLDCVVLIERGQAVCEVAGSEVTVNVGTRQFTVARRAVVWLNPLTPWRLTVKASAPWDAPKNARSAAQLRQLWPLRAMTTLQAIVLMVISPILL